MDRTKIGIRDHKTDKVKNIAPPTYNEMYRALKYKSREKLVNSAFGLCEEMSGTPVFDKGTREDLIKLSKGKLAKLIINLSISKQQKIKAERNKGWYKKLPIIKQIIWISRKLNERKRSIMTKKFFQLQRRVEH